MGIVLENMQVGSLMMKITRTATTNFIKRVIVLYLRTCAKLYNCLQKYKRILILIEICYV